MIITYIRIYLHVLCLKDDIQYYRVQYKRYTFTDRTTEHSLWAYKYKKSHTERKRTYTLFLLWYRYFYDYNDSPRCIPICISIVNNYLCNNIMRSINDKHTYLLLHKRKQMPRREPSSWYRSLSTKISTSTYSLMS